MTTILLISIKQTVIPNTFLRTAVGARQNVGLLFLAQPQLRLQGQNEQADELTSGTESRAPEVHSYANGADL